MVGDSGQTDGRCLSNSSGEFTIGQDFVDRSNWIDSDSDEDTIRGFMMS